MYRSSFLKMDNISIWIIWKNNQNEKYLDILSSFVFSLDKLKSKNIFSFNNEFLWSFDWKLDFEYESTKQKEIFNIDLLVNWDFLNIDWKFRSNFDKSYWSFDIKTPSNYIELDEKKIEEFLMWN